MSGCGGGGTRCARGTSTGGWSREKERARERAAHAAEVERLAARVRELEGTNMALGKAIGLLHAMNEHEPAATRTTTDPSDS